MIEYATEVATALNTLLSVWFVHQRRPGLARPMDLSWTSAPYSLLQPHVCQNGEKDQGGEVAGLTRPVIPD